MSGTVPAMAVSALSACHRSMAITPQTGNDRRRRATVARVARRPHSDMPDEEIFHVGARDAGRIPIFLDDDDRHFFLLLLGVAVAKYEWHYYTFCLMRNHYHLVV